MRQHEAVILSMEQLGGQATLAQLYQNVMKISNCQWNTKTPFASIRRIVQIRPEIFKIRPGLYALRSHQAELGLIEENDESLKKPEVIDQNHTYYQGLLVELGNLRNYDTYIPNQDQNKIYINKPLKQIRSLQSIPNFSYEKMVSKSKSIDVIWFNHRKMPHTLIEVEFTTDFQNSLLKFIELQDFNVQMVICADENKRKEFQDKICFEAFREIKERVRYLNFETLVHQYEFEAFKRLKLFVI